jgi:hypothetical protein
VYIREGEYKAKETLYGFSYISYGKFYIAPVCSATSAALYPLYKYDISIKLDINSNKNNSTQIILDYNLFS